MCCFVHSRKLIDSGVTSVRSAASTEYRHCRASTAWDQLPFAIEGLIFSCLRVSFSPDQGVLHGPQGGGGASRNRKRSRGASLKKWGEPSFFATNQNNEISLRGLKPARISGGLG